VPEADLPPAAEALDPRVVRTRRDVLDATITELVEGGWDAVTHARVAARAGYAKATLYAHWPDRLALVSDAFAAFGGMPHHEPTGTCGRTCSASSCPSAPRWSSTG
jgi:AcrR family transcriptional regulator